MLNLNFALYSGGTLLRDWWRQVKTHFTEVQSAHNALEVRLGEESERLSGLISAEETSRQNGDSALSDRINSEKGDRESADAALGQRIASARTELLEAVSAERTARQTEDGLLSDRASILEAKAHTHSNASLLDSISSADIAALREGIDYNTENALMLAYLFELLIECENNIGLMYGDMGVTLYDGGFYTGYSEDEEVILDGGDFDEEGEPMDCGTFEESYVALSQILDGGQY